MGLSLGPPPGPFPLAVGGAMLLMMANAVVDILAGLVASAFSIPVAALAYVFGIGFLILAVGLARVRPWALSASSAWTLLATIAGAAMVVAGHDPRFLPILPAVALVLVLLPATRRGVRPGP
jgi:hypothetical protein